MKLEAVGLCYRYGPTSPEVLKDLTFTLDPGSYWCVAGPNGSGKSTFLKLAAGLLEPQRLGEGMKGRLNWDGTPIAKWILPAERLKLARAIAFVPGSLVPRFSISVFDFVLQGRYPHSQFWTVPSTKDRDLAQAALERVGLSSMASRLLNELSAGETQLVVLARALAQQPRVLILDEATASLDLGFQEKIFGLLHELHRSGMTILIVSHDLNLAAEFCPNVLWLSRGSVYDSGPMVEKLNAGVLHALYGDNLHIEVGTNPFSGKPKIFWNQKT